MGQVAIEFLETRKHKSLVWFCYMDDVFFILTNGKEKLSPFLEDWNKFHPNIKFTHGTSEESIHFLDLRLDC